MHTVQYVSIYYLYESFIGAPCQMSVSVQDHFSLMDQVITDITSEKLLIYLTWDC